MEITNVPLWLCIPFAGLLLCIAVFPLVKAEWWEKNRPWVVLCWSVLLIVAFAVWLMPAGLKVRGRGWRLDGWRL